LKKDDEIPNFGQAANAYLENRKEFVEQKMIEKL